MNIKKQQTRQIRQIINKATATETGEKYNFEEIQGYAEFRDRLPISEYRDIKQAVERLKGGESNILWPGHIDKFSISAGTTGSGKHLPLSRERLRSDQTFIRKVAFQYFKQKPTLAPLLGKHISLPGSLEEVTQSGRTIQMGEISGFLGNMTPLLLRPLQLVSPESLLNLPFSKKFNRVLEASLNADIRVITAVPSWILTLFQHVLERTGKNSIGEVWPNLKLMICGGVKLDHYRDHLQALCGKLQPDFIETYGASEGYFSFTDNLQQSDMKLITNNGIFYEWIPHGTNHDNPIQPIPTWKVRTGVPYAMLVTTNAGLWRYAVNDVIEFTSITPPRIRVKGRVQDVLDPYGEAVYGWEAEKALEQSCDDADLGWNSFTLGSLLQHEHERPRHYWFIEFHYPDKIDSTALDQLAGHIDDKLRNINRHYEIRRDSEALASPKVIMLTRPIKRKWLKSRNKIGAQNKLPRIIHSQEALQQLLSYTRPNTGNS